MNLAKYIDHTVLKADTTREAVLKVCSEAREHHFFSVCVNPWYVPLVAAELNGTDVKVCSVIGFPLGASVSEIKALEAQRAIADGADEIDMVINVAALKNGDLDVVEADIKAVSTVCKGKALLKVIIETCLLTDDEKRIACELSVKAGADFVKTSTGFSTSGATVADIQLMRSVVGPHIGVKASGGVRDRETALALVEAGASRIGASASVSIVKGENIASDGY